MIKWNRTGQLGISWSGDLELIDATGRTISRLDLNTIPTKCGFSDSQIYCAAPSNQNSVSSSSYPDDYLKRALKSNDDLFVIPLVGLSAGEFPVIRLASLESDAERIEIAGDQLLFLNRFDKNLYLLEL